MTTALHLAKPDDLDRLCRLVAGFHQEAGIEQSEEVRRDGLTPLLEGVPHGVVYLMGPTRAPIGYVVVTFGWSVEFGGMDAFIDELYLRRAVRRRGIATEVLISLPKALGDAGVKGLHLEVDREDESAQRLYARAGFRARERYMLMSRRL